MWRQRMDDNLSRLIDESITLELNVAALYLSFCNTFSEDLSFWWNLAAMEEKNHASLLESGRRYFVKAGLFPSQIVNMTVESLVQANSELKRLLEEQKEIPPSRESAFN